MQLVPFRPITIEKVRFGERWFPRVFRHPSGNLLLYIEYGHDAHFAPDFRMQSHDEGMTWHSPTDHVPRAGWCHSFADGQLFEIDSYGIHDPKTPSISAFYAAWSDPSRPAAGVHKKLARVNFPSGAKLNLNKLHAGYPKYPWWPLWNGLHAKNDLSGDEIHLLGPHFTSGVQLAGGRLLALGYWQAADSGSKYCVWAFQSDDRGETWNEISLVGRRDDTPEGANEASLVQLRDGRLYAVVRTGKLLMHTWSSDQGVTWTPLQPLTLIDEPAHAPGMVWPVLKVLEDGTLVLVYGRPGKHLVFDPSGTGTQWQGRLDLHAWELETQALMGVPPEQRLRGPTHLTVRYWDSGDYLFVVPAGQRELLVGYDVQNYVEHRGAPPISGVRMVRVTLV